MKLTVQAICVLAVALLCAESAVGMRVRMRGIFPQIQLFRRPRVHLPRAPVFLAIPSGHPVPVYSHGRHPAGVSYRPGGAPPPNPHPQPIHITVVSSDPPKEQHRPHPEPEYVEVATEPVTTSEHPPPSYSPPSHPPPSSYPPIHEAPLDEHEFSVPQPPKFSAPEQEFAIPEQPQFMAPKQPEFVIPDEQPEISVPRAPLFDETSSFNAVDAEFGISSSAGQLAAPVTPSFDDSFFGAQTGPFGGTDLPIPDLTNIFGSATFGEHPSAVAREDTGATGSEVVSFAVEPHHGNEVSGGKASDWNAPQYYKIGFSE